MLIRKVYEQNVRHYYSKASIQPRKKCKNLYTNIDILGNLK